jgi:DNA-binding transcriptional LysR family regulator
MEFHQLRYFVAAAEELSITRAAERLHVSQPALSRQIASLEDEVGVPLFERIRKRIHLTDAGRFFLPKARQILCDAETSVQQVREKFGAARRTIRLGFQTPFLDDIVAPALKVLRKEKRRASVDLFELGPRAQLDRLRDGELDLILVGNMLDEDRERFGVRRLMRAKMAIVLPADHRLAGRKQVSLKEVAEDPHVSLTDAVFPGRREFVTKIFRSQGLDARFGHECDSLSLLLGEVSTGDGVALLPHHCKKLPHAGCVFVRLKTPTVYSEIIAVYNKGVQDDVLAALLEQLTAAAAKLSEE